LNVSESETRAQEQLDALLTRRAQIETEKRQELRRLDENAEGLTSRGRDILRSQAEARFDAQLGDIDIQAQSFQGAIDSSRQARSDSMNQIRLIQEMTGEQQIGGIQTDPMTGVQFAYFQDPITGSVTTRQLGAIGIEPEILSVAEAQTLGVPYGTTVQQAQQMGIVPQRISSGGDGSLYGLTPSQYFSAISTARSFEDSPIGKQFSLLSSGYASLRNVDPATKNPAVHQQVIYNFVKTLDPESVVREGEYATAQKYTQSLVAQYGKSIEQAINGTGILSDQAIRDIQQAAQANYESRLPLYEQERNRYVGYLTPVVGGMAEGLVSNYALPPIQQIQLSDDEAAALINQTSGPAEPSLIEASGQFFKNSYDGVKNYFSNLF
jgi:hypothetical protein